MYEATPARLRGPGSSSGTWAGLAYPARVRWGGPLCAGCSLAGSKLTCQGVGPAAVSSKGRLSTLHESPEHALDGSAEMLGVSRKACA